MAAALKSSAVAVAMTKRLGGQTLCFVRNAGGGATPRPPGAGGIPFPPGPKQMQQMRNWVSATSIYGAVSFVGLCYFSDWRVICDWIPFYSGKYKDD